MSALFFGALLVILTFYIRIKPRLSQRNFGIDSWYYLLYADELRKTKRLPVKLPYFLLDIEEQWYPPALPGLLALFPQRFLEKYHWAISAFIDTIQMVTLYIASYLVTDSLMVSCIASLLYATSPILVTQNSNLNSRALGSIFLTLVMLSLYQYISSANFLYLLLTILLGAISLHTHKMATQQMVFLLIGFSIFYLNPLYILILVAIWAAAFVLSWGFYLKILKSHIGVLRFCRKNFPYFFTHQVYQSPVYANQKKAAANKGCGGIAASRLWYGLAKFNFIFIFIVISVYTFINRHILNASDSFYLGWGFINLMSIVIITYITPVKFLGEGQRYYMYGIFPLSFLLSRFIFERSIDIYIGILFLSIILIINIFLIKKIHNEQKKNILAILDDDLYDVIKHIKGLPKDNVMCFPISYCEPVAYFSAKKTLRGDHSYGFDKLQPFFPVLLKRVEYFIQSYDISYCLINKNYVAIKDIFLSINYKTIMERGQYCLIEFIKEN